MIKMDYIGQLLIGRENNLKQNSIITIAGINSNFQRLQENVSGRNGYKDEIQREETLAIIKLTYMNVIATIAKMHGGELPGAYEEFDKSQVKQSVADADRNLKQEIIVEEEQNEETRRTNNEYRKLLVTQRIPIEEVRVKYLEYLKLATRTLDEQISRGNYNLEKNREQEKILREKARAFELLSDPEYKLKLDELLLFNFSPNQEKLYVPKYVSEMTYMPKKPQISIDAETGTEVQTLKSMKFGSISAGDETETTLIHVGDLGFGRFRQANSGKMTYRDPEKIKMYVALKTYRDKKLAERRKARALMPESLTRWDLQTDSEIFVVTGNLHENLLRREDIDKEFIRYTQEVLLSTTNLDEAVQYNGGYIGEVGLDQSKTDYMVIYDREALCISKEFQKAGEIVGLREGLETKVVRYKIDQGIVEIYDRNSETGQIERQVVAASENSIKRDKIEAKDKKILNSNGGER